MTNHAVRRYRKPRKVVAWYRDTMHCLDLGLCREALVRCQVAGKFDSMEQLAVAVGCSRSTASRFFSGKSLSLRATLAVLDQLGLSFEEAVKPIGAIEECE